MDWLIWVLIGITVFEFWRLHREDKKSGISFSWSDLSPSNFFDGEGIGCLIVLIFGGLILLFQESVEARIFLVLGIAIYCGVRYFKSEKESMQKKEMGFFKKLTEYICLILLSLMIGFAILTVAVPDMQRYDRKQEAKKYIQQLHQQQSQSVSTQYQR